MNSNLYYIIILHVCFIKLAATVRHNYSNYQLCANETNFDINATKSRNINQLHSGQEYKCYKRCINLKLEIISENGNLNFDKIMKKYGLKIQSLKLAEIKKCKSSSTNKCDKADEILKCVENVMHTSALFERRLMKYDCLKTTNVNISDYKQAYNNDNLTLYNSHSLKCYRRCILIKKGLMDDAGVPNYDVWNTSYPLPNNNQKYLDAKTCTSKEQDSCNKADEIRECMLEKLDQFYNVTKWSRECRNENGTIEINDKNRNQCYIRCMRLKRGYIKDNGEPNLEQIINSLGISPNAANIDAANECDSITTDLCIRSQEMFNCIYEKLDKRFL